MKKFICLIFLFIVLLTTFTACSNETKETFAELEVTEAVETTVAETTEPEVTTTITEETEIHLENDVFPKNEFTILHTDFEPSEELMDEIMYYINRYSKNCSLYMVNLEDYATFGYNSDYYIPTASTIKCPFSFYCYQEIQRGNNSFNEQVLYKSGYYSNGTGILKDYGTGTYYSVRDLLYYTIHFSDNVAFLMLQDHFGYEGYNQMIEDYGFEPYINDTIKWGKLSSHALGFIWTEIYKYKDECDEGAIFYDTLLNAQSNFLTWPLTEAGYDYKVAHKSGWAEPGYHDSGIVYAEQPYVIVVMTESNGELEDNGFFYNIVIKLNELHEEYMQYTKNQ